MMWTTHNHSQACYPPDLTGDERALIAPLILPAKPGNPRMVDLREMINGSYAWHRMPVPSNSDGPCRPVGRCTIISIRGFIAPCVYVAVENQVQVAPH